MHLVEGQRSIYPTALKKEAMKVPKVQGDIYQIFAIIRKTLTKTQYKSFFVLLC